MFRKAIFYSLKITKFRTFREKLLFQLHSTPTFLPLATFKKNHFFLKKRCFFLKKPKHCTFWEILLSQSLSTANFLHLTFSGFERFQYFVSRNPSIFLKPNFFEKFYYLSRFLRHFFYIEWFPKTSLNLMCFFKKTQIFNVLRFFSRSVALYSKLSTFNF